jgi:hypothetical protein
MESSKKLLSSILVLMLSPGALFAQKALSDWGNVEKLKPGTKIIVTTKNGREFAGEKRQSTDDTLFMETRFPVQGTRTFSLTKDEIAEVRKIKSRWLLPLVGAAVGIGVGIAIGSTADHPYTDDPNLGKMLGGGLGGLIGFGTGSMIHRKAKTIYVTP